MERVKKFQLKMDKLKIDMLKYIVIICLSFFRCGTEKNIQPISKENGENYTNEIYLNDNVDLRCLKNTSQVVLFKTTKAMFLFPKKEIIKIVNSSDKIKLNNLFLKRDTILMNNYYRIDGLLNIISVYDLLSIIEKGKLQIKDIETSKIIHVIQIEKRIIGSTECFYIKNVKGKILLKHEACSYPLIYPGG